MKNGSSVPRRPITRGRDDGSSTGLASLRTCAPIPFSVKQRRAQSHPPTSVSAYRLGRCGSHTSCVEGDRHGGGRVGWQPAGPRTSFRHVETNFRRRGWVGSRHRFANGGDPVRRDARPRRHCPSVPTPERRRRGSAGLRPHMWYGGRTGVGPRVVSGLPITTAPRIVTA